jgi:hypothetical protein
MVDFMPPEHLCRLLVDVTAVQADVAAALVILV